VWHVWLIYSFTVIVQSSQAPKKSTKKTTKKTGSNSTPPAPKANPLFPSRPRSFGIGGNVRPLGRDLSRFVRWPKYIRIQRQRAVLYQRLKVPPAINQFTKSLGKNEAATLFKLLDNYRPETNAAKKQRIKEAAAAAAASSGKSGAKTASNTLQYGLKHVTQLVEEKKASLVVIACDVDPIELVVWLPALCRKMDVPFCIVKDKARLGALVHKKNAAVVALTTVDPADVNQLDIMKNLSKEKFNNNVDLVRKWGGGVMGLKTQAKLDKRAKAMAIEEAKKAATRI